MSELIQLPLNLTLIQTKGPEPEFHVVINSSVFKDIDFKGGVGKTMSEALYQAASTVSQYEELTEDERMITYLSNPHNRREAMKLAMKFGKVTRFNSFTIDMIKKNKNKIHGSPITNEELITNLQNLIMFRMCISKKSEQETVSFKISIEPKDLKMHISEEIKTHHAVIKQLEVQLKDIEQEIEDKEKNNAATETTGQ